PPRLPCPRENVRRRARRAHRVPERSTGSRRNPEDDGRNGAAGKKCLTVRWTDSIVRVPHAIAFCTIAWGQYTADVTRPSKPKKLRSPKGGGWPTSRGILHLGVPHVSRFSRRGRRPRKVFRSPTSSGVRGRQQLIPILHTPRYPLLENREKRGTPSL